MIFLAKIGLLDLLDKLFDEVYITEAVYEETVIEGSNHEESSLIAQAEFLKKAKVSDQRLVRFSLR